MDWFTAMFPEHAEAQNLKRIAKTLELQAARGRGKSSSSAGDADTLTLVLLSVIKSLVDKGILTHEDITSQILELDSLDGKADGKLTVDALRAKFDLPAAKKKRTRKKSGIIRKRK